MSKIVCSLLAVIALVVSGCAGAENYTTTGAVAGGAYGALLGCFIGAIFFQNCELGAAGGALAGIPAGAAIGYNSDQKVAQQQTLIAQQQAALATMGVENCEWVYDSRGQMWWVCSGNQRRYRPNGPPSIPFSLPPQMQSTPPAATSTPSHAQPIQVPVVVYK